MNKEQIATILTGHKDGEVWCPTRLAGTGRLQDAIQQIKRETHEEWQAKIAAREAKDIRCPECHGQIGDEPHFCTVAEEHEAYMEKIADLSAQIVELKAENEKLRRLNGNQFATIKRFQKETDIAAGHARMEEESANINLKKVKVLCQMEALKLSEEIANYKATMAGIEARAKDGNRPWWRQIFG